MTKAETIQVITLLAGNYDNIAKKDAMQKQLMVNTWQECLGDLDYNLVLQAVKKTIITSEYPPTIHEIRKNAMSLMQSDEQQSSLKAWNEAYKMICNGLYMTEEEFNKHTEEVKEFFGCVQQVRELAKSDIDKVNTVTKGQFLRQYEIIQQRLQEQRLLPDNMKDNLKLLGDNTIKQIN